MVTTSPSGNDVTTRNNAVKELLLDDYYAYVAKLRNLSSDEELQQRVTDFVTMEAPNFDGNSNINDLKAFLTCAQNAYARFVMVCQLVEDEYLYRIVDAFQDLVYTAKDLIEKLEELEELEEHQQ